MSPDIIEARIWEILERDLNLDDDGEMIMPLKKYEVDLLFHSILALVDEAVGEADR